MPLEMKKPFEVAIEATQYCNYSCSFCFAKNFSTTTTPNSQNAKNLETVIEKLACEGIERIRFTGGEPLLLKETPALIKFAKKQGLFTSLNTNASLLPPELAKELAPFLDDALVSFHACDEAQEEKLSKKKGFFESKLRAIKGLAGEGVFVRAATILSNENIPLLEKFHSLVESLPVSQWVLLRPIPNPAQKHPISPADVAEAVEKIIEFNKGKKRPQRTLIENALPFCSYFPEKVKQVALGGLREDGHSTLFVNSSLEIKPSYFLGPVLGLALKDPVMAAWNSDFMKRMHALEFIAEECHACRHVRECMGGSRFSALFVNGSLYSRDPLARPEEFINTQ